MARLQGLLLCLILVHSVMSVDWESYNGQYYYFSAYEEALTTWQQARANCMSYGGNLASILNDNEKDWIQNKVDSTGYLGRYWIGLSAFDRNNWVWSDSTSNVPWYWRNEYPETSSTLGLTMMCAVQQSGSPNADWTNVPCGFKFAYVCKANNQNNPPVTDPPPTDAPGYCPKGYFGFHEKCYKMVFGDPDVDGVTWEEAARICRTEQAGVTPDLATISDDLTNAMLGSQIQSFTHGLWIGYHREYTGAAWTWLDNTVNLDNYEKWGPYEPSGSTSDCAEMWHTPGPPGTWNNIDCKSKRGYICQTSRSASNVISTPNPTTENTCKTGYTPYWYGCYRFDNELRTWDDAQANCAKDGGNLASIHYEAENLALSTKVMKYGELTWIGLRDYNSKGEFTWSDTWAVFYTRWGVDEPTGRVGDCVAMGTDGHWYERPCDAKFASICKQTDAPAITTPAHAIGSCPGEEFGETEWTPHGDYCYWASDPDDWQTTTWKGAQESCLQKHYMACLVSIHSLAENEFIGTIAKKGMYSSTAFWTGGYRSQLDGSYHWLDGSAIQYTNWAPGEPNGEGTGEHCIEYYADYYPKMWNDNPCNYYRNYICKVPKLPLVTQEPFVPGTCDDGWTAWGGHCYYFAPELVGHWQTAVETCAKLGGPEATLPSITSYFENKFIRDEMVERNQLPEKWDYWIGLVKDGPGVDGFYWMDGTEFNDDSYKQWGPGEPNDYEGIEHCVEAYSWSGSWNDIYCDAARSFVCKKPKTPLEVEDPQPSLSTGATAGIVVGVLICIVLIVIVLVFVLNKTGVIDVKKHANDTKVLLGFSNMNYEDNKAGATEA